MILRADGFESTEREDQGLEAILYGFEENHDENGELSSDEESEYEAFLESEFERLCWNGY